MDQTKRLRQSTKSNQAGFAALIVLLLAGTMAGLSMMTIQYGIPVARIELLDTLSVKAANAYSKLDLPETPLLLLEFHGSEAGVVEQSDTFGEIAGEKAGSGKPRLSRGSGVSGEVTKTGGGRAASHAAPSPAYSAAE